MIQSDVTTSGSNSAKALVSPTAGVADEMLADIAQAAETLANIAQTAISVASTDAPGRVELATAEETAAGTDGTRAVTPAGLAAQHYIKSTDITYKALNDNGDVGCDTNQVARGDHAHLNASSAAAGFMSAADKAKLDGILPAGRGIVTPEGDDPAISMELPAAVDRRDFLLGFTATGAVTTTKVATAKDVDDIAARGMTTVDTIADLGAARRRAGGAVHVRGYHKPGDGGGGTFMWDATSTKAPNHGTVLAVDGIATGRWLREINTQMWNVKWFGAKGDGTGDDAPAIQAAMNTQREVFLPKGTYRIAKTLIWGPYSTKLVGEDGLGWAGTQILDARISPGDEPMLRNSGGWMKFDGTFTNGSGGNVDLMLCQFLLLKNLRFSACETGNCVEIDGAVNGFHIENCKFEGYRGLTVGEGTHDGVVINCVANSRFVDFYDKKWDTPVPSYVHQHWGYYAAGTNVNFYGCVAVGLGCGFFLCSNSVNVFGGRCEVNGYGAVIGRPRFTPSGQIRGTYCRSIFTGVTMEANWIGMEIYDTGNDATISNVGMQGSQAESNRKYTAKAGLIVRNGLGEIRNINPGGIFTSGALINHSVKPLINCTAYAGGMKSGGELRPLGGDNSGTVTPHYHFLGTKLFPHAENIPHTTVTAFHDLMVQGLTGLNVRDRALSGISKGGPIFARNLGGVVNPESSSLKANVKFDARFNPVHANFTTSPTAVASDNCALEPKTYYYAATGLGKTGEVGVDYNNINDWNYRSVNVSAGQKVTMSVSWMSNLKRRIYRGTSPGEFDGYWEWETGVNPSPFVDDGNIPFTGKGMPPHTGDLWHRYEDDANYQIVATPSWATTVYVTNKATTGFTLNFSSTAPDANQTVSWLMFRP